MTKRVLHTTWILLIAVTASAASAADYPSWWTNRSVLNTNLTAYDYAPATAGQLKWFATNAYDELEAHLPGGAGTNLAAFVAALPSGDNYAPVNLGQLKNTALPFYDRLIAKGYTNSYPWSSNTTADDSDYSPANIGQLKTAFGFDIQADSDADGLPNWWESYYGLNYSLDDSYFDPDDDDLTNLQEYQNACSPQDSDSDDDGMPDGWEAGYDCAGSPDPSVADADSNPDQDGFVNVAEYLWSFDPCTSNAGPTTTTVFYVESSLGSDTNDGSANSPFITIQRGIGAAYSNGGGRVVVAAGEYHETNTLYNNVFVEGASQTNTIIIGRITATSASNFGVRDITVRESFGNKSGINFVSCNACYIRSVKSENHYYEGLRFYASSGLIVQATSCANSKGLLLVDGAHAQISDSDLNGNDNEGLKVESGSYVFSSATDTITNGSYGLYLLGGSTALVEKCMIRNNGDVGVLVESSSDVIINNSLLLGNESYGLKQNAGTDGSVIMNHSIVAYNVIAGVYVHGSDEQFKAVNSVLWLNDKDIHYSANSNQFYNCNLYDEQWNGHNGNVYRVMPQWRQSDYHLQASSSLIDLGSTTNGYDWDEEVRPYQTNDIGVDEFIDGDGDHIPDWWELNYGFSTNSNDADADRDGDGLDNLDEYLTGNNPDGTNIVIYVNDQTGSDDTGDGSSGNPYKTISKGIIAVKALGLGDVNIAAGTYNETNTISNSMRLVGAGTTNTIIKGSFKVEHCKDVKFKSLAICETSSSYDDGIEITHSYNIYIDDVLFEETRYGITVQKSIAFIDNVVMDNLNAGVFLNMHCIASVSNSYFGSQCQYGVRSTYDNTCTSNELNIFSSEIKATDYGVALARYSDAVINDCIIENANYGLKSDRASNVYIYNTAFAKNGTAIKHGNTIYAGDTGNYVVAHCALYDNTLGIEADKNTNRVFLYNSIFWDNNDDIGAGILTGQVWSCNISDGDFTNCNGNFSSEPLWRKAVEGDFHLTSNSPCINAGTNIYTIPDIDGETRPHPVTNNVDVGIDEYIDADADGLPDYWEKLHFEGIENCLPSADDDGEGLTNLAEYLNYTDPQDADTDDDDLTDNEEINGAYYGYYTDPRNSDTDGDLLYDGEEVITNKLIYHLYGCVTCPTNVDTDGDNICDGPTTPSGYCAGPDPSPTNATESGHIYAQITLSTSTPDVAEIFLLEIQLKFQETDYDVKTARQFTLKMPAGARFETVVRGSKYQSSVTPGIVYGNTTDNGDFAIEVQAVEPGYYPIGVSDLEDINCSIPATDTNASELYSYNGTVYESKWRGRHLWQYNNGLHSVTTRLYDVATNIEPTVATYYPSSWSLGGCSFSEIVIGINGYFLIDAVSPLTNVLNNITNAPEGFVGAFHDDLVLTTNSKIYVGWRLSTEPIFSIQWIKMAHSNDDQAEFTFQADILQETEKVRFSYYNMYDASNNLAQGQSALIGFNLCDSTSLTFSQSVQRYSTIEKVNTNLAAFFAVDVDDDYDRLIHNEELSLSTDPYNGDSDDDGLGDYWEVDYMLDPLDDSGIHGPDADGDADNYKNIIEFYIQSDPLCACSPFYEHNLGDEDEDGIADDWELTYYNALTNVSSIIDTDYDGMPDDLEIQYFGSAAAGMPLDDDDHDGYVNVLELVIGGDPTNSMDHGQHPYEPHGGISHIKYP